jgi:hemerythrin-like domain-containing protein
MDAGEALTEIVDGIIRDFITHERHHMAMEERLFFPAAIKALQPDDWAEIASTLSDKKHPLFSEVVEERLEAVRKHILQLEQRRNARAAPLACNRSGRWSCWL